MNTYAARESLRHSFRPDTIRVLFVGESPPVGGTFFYKADSNLACYTQEAFMDVFGEVVGTGESFLAFFKKLGCYLDDLCLIPINHEKDKRKRRCYRRQGVDELAIRIRAASPQAIVVVMKGIKPFVEDATQRTGLDSIRMEEALPFPAQGHQQQYVSGLHRVLHNLQNIDILPGGHTLF